MLDINIQTPPYEASSLANKLKNKLAKWIIWSHNCEQYVVSV
jgi:hypothetical protein